MEEAVQILRFTDQIRDIVITSHRNPDGDAIGSALALKHILVQRFHNVKVIVPSEFPDNLNWLAGAEDIIVYDREPEEAIEAVQKCTLAFCLDFNSLDRIDKLGNQLTLAEVPMIMIDHHLYPENFAEVMISDPNVSSTCELLYETAKILGWDKNLPLPAIESLLTGIITDTGSFKHNVYGKTFSNVGELINKGGDMPYVQDRLFNHNPVKILRLLGFALYHRMVIMPESKAGYIYLTRKDYIDFNIQRGDTEGIVNHLLSLHDIHVAAFITEQPSIVKVSLRSKGDFSVQKVCSEYFKGGGHKNASGGALNESLQHVIDLFKEAVEKYKTEIINSY